MEHQAYRCCLPTLAGFAGNHCIGPDLRRRPAVCSPTSPPRRGIRPSYSGLLVQGTANSPPSTTKKPGADGQDRTDDLRFTKPLLYQLSYIGETLILPLILPVYSVTNTLTSYDKVT